uniref:Uncharacterized protein n=1 Tax=Avena sativa TaxID=4498 RepID=A0ACD5YYP9_AVESA
MSQSSADAYSDDDGLERTQIRVTRARLSSPGAGNNAVAPYVPRVIRAAAAVSRYTPASARGYSPKLSVDMAVAHSWAPYAAVVHALSSLSLLALKGDRDREVARETVAELYAHPAPFGAAPARRFPEGEVYVCLDRPPFARKMEGIQAPLSQADASQYGKEFANACYSYVHGIGNAMDELTRVNDRGDLPPVLYDRAAFESAFLLTWAEQ